MPDEPKKLTRASTIQGFKRALEDYDVDPYTILEAIDIPGEVLDDGDNLLPIDDIARLLVKAAQATGNPGFTLHLVSRQDFSFAGLLGLLMQTAPSFGEALKEAPRYIHVLTQSLTYHLDTQGHLCRFSLSIDDVSLARDHRQIIAELALAECYKLLTILTNQKLNLSRVEFRSPPPENTLAIERFFRAPAIFNSEHEGLVFDSHYLTMEVCHSNRMLHEIVRNQIEHSSAFHDGHSLPQQVRNIIRTHLSERRFDIDTVAKSLGRDKRTLQRQLQINHDTTYQDLLNEVRFELAKLYLEETQMPLTQLTYILGFSDPSNMSRAFRKHSGESPKAWRTRNARI